MISFDTNVLLPGTTTGHPQRAKAEAFLRSLHAREDVAISEFVLVELYVLLRNPAVSERPLSSSQAAAACQRFRNHPKWKVLGFTQDSKALHDELWREAANEQWARRRIYDTRMALSLRYQGVTEFATVNLRDFQEIGFRRVWNPLE